jgi:hypothetical protein
LPKAGQSVVRRAELRLRSGYRQQPGKLIVADLGLGDQNTAVEMLELDQGRQGREEQDILDLMDGEAP